MGCCFTMERNTWLHSEKSRTPTTLFFGRDNSGQSGQACEYCIRSVLTGPHNSGQVGTNPKGGLFASICDLRVSNIDDKTDKRPPSDSSSTH